MTFDDRDRFYAAVLNNDEAAQGQQGCVTVENEEEGCFEIASCDMEVTEIVTSGVYGDCAVASARLLPDFTEELAGVRVVHTWKPSFAGLPDPEVPGQLPDPEVPGQYNTSCMYRACLRNDGTKCCEATVVFSINIIAE